MSRAGSIKIVARGQMCWRKMKNGYRRWLALYTLIANCQRSELPVHVGCLMRGDLIRRPIDMSLMRAGGIFFPVHFAPCKECGGGPAAKHKSGRTAEGLCEHIGRESCARWDELHVLHHCGMKSLMATKWVVDLVLISVKLKNIFSTFAEGCMVHVDN